MSRGTFRCTSTDGCEGDMEVEYDLLLETGGWAAWPDGEVEVRDMVLPKTCDLSEDGW